MKDAVWMRRALQLARQGLGSVSPNPMVGCVIIHHNKIIGEGYHKQYGKAHAEVNAINAVKEKSLLADATAYVTLEPCSHFGKTPPCADLLVQHRLKRVVVATLDPNPNVAGKGIEKLRAAGITTEIGVLAQEATTMNRRFLTAYTKKRPYIILKWAETADGYMARSDYKQVWISNPLARKLVHKWRTEEDAIMIGANTARYDNPQLTAREWQGTQPLRIVAEHTSQLPNTLKMFQGEVPALRYRVGERIMRNENRIYLAEDSFLTDLFSDLLDRGVQSVIVEGGRFLLHKLLEANLWDEIRQLKAPHSLKAGISAPQPQGVLVQSNQLLDNVLQIFHNKP